MPEQVSRRRDIAELRAAAAAQAATRAGPTGRLSPALAALAAVLAFAVAAGLIWSALSRPDGAAGVPEPAPVLGPERTAWEQVLADLDARRAEAFSIGDSSLIEGVYAAGSAALAQDVDRLERFAHVGVTARGLRIEVVAVRLVDTAPGEVGLRVRDRMPPYDIVATTGELVERRPGRGEREWLVTLVAAPAAAGEWRISAIEPAAG